MNHWIQCCKGDHQVRTGKVDKFGVPEVTDATAISNDGGHTICALVLDGQEVAARLLVEAGSVHAATGKTPLELQARIVELEAVVAVGQTSQSITNRDLFAGLALHALLSSLPTWTAMYSEMKEPWLEALREAGFDGEATLSPYLCATAFAVTCANKLSRHLQSGDAPGGKSA